MGTLLGGSQRSNVRQALKNSSRPLDQDEVARKAGLSKDKTREILGQMVDQGEVTTTLNWKYTLTE